MTQLGRVSANPHPRGPVTTTTVPLDSLCKVLDLRPKPGAYRGLRGTIAVRNVPELQSSGHVRYSLNS